MTRKKTTAKLQKNGLTRREELYLSIIGRMVSRHLTYDGKWVGNNDTPRENGMRLENEYKVGDLVLTYTSIGRRHNIWNIAIVHELAGYSACVLRDIFTGELCNYGNEDFKKIVGVPFEVQLDNEQYALWSTFKRACYLAENEMHYYLIPVSASFDKDTATYATREKWMDELTYHTFPVDATEQDMEKKLRIHLDEIKQRRLEMRNAAADTSSLDEHMKIASGEPQ